MRGQRSESRQDDLKDSIVTTKKPGKTPHENSRKTRDMSYDYKKSKNSEAQANVVVVPYIRNKVVDQINKDKEKYKKLEKVLKTSIENQEEIA